MKKRNPLIIAIILFITLIVAAYITLKIQNSPIRSLEKMFSLRADMKLDEYYNSFDMSGVDKNLFTSLDSFLEMSSEKGWKEIDSFKIDKKEDLTFTVKYNDTIEEITLVPQEKKSLFIFDTYKIDITSMLSSVMCVSVQPDAKLYIDGELVDKKYLSNLENSGEYHNESYENYIFSNVFDKAYDVKVLTEYTEPYMAIIRPSETPYVLRDLKLSEEAENAIHDVSQNFIQRFYYALQDGENFDSLIQYITEDEKKRSEIQASYDNLYHLFTRGKEINGLIDICFLDNITTVSYPDEHAIEQTVYPTTTTVRYSYNFLEYDMHHNKHTLHTDLFDETTFTILCTFENGKWVVTGVDNLLINMSY